MEGKQDGYLNLSNSRYHRVDVNGLHDFAAERWNIKNEKLYEKPEHDVFVKKFLLKRKECNSLDEVIDTSKRLLTNYNLLSAFK
jgi:hypothetical protein